MGFDHNIFVDRPDDEFICCICTDVLEDAVQLFPCQHLYCRSCLANWFEVSKPKTKCPIDGRQVNQKNVTAIPRSLHNIMAKLKVRCDRCQQVMPLCKYRSHNCFQEILSQMGDYIQEIDTVLMILELSQAKIVD